MVTVHKKHEYQHIEMCFVINILSDTCLCQHYTNPIFTLQSKGKKETPWFYQCPPQVSGQVGLNRTEKVVTTAPAQP